MMFADQSASDGPSFWAFLGVALFIVWMFVPFWIKKLLNEQRRTNELLEYQNSVLEHVHGINRAEESAPPDQNPPY